MLLLIPFIIWIAVNIHFFNGHASVAGDNPPYFHYIMHHVKALSRGVVPLWNPYHAWGSLDVLNLRGLGDLNPWFLLVLIPLNLGIEPYFSILAVVVLYFFLGCIGFYVLVRQISGDRQTAFLAYVLFMFSNLGIVLFEQFVVLFIFVPAVWFFVFLGGFLKTATERHRLANVVGMTFSLMLVVTTYIPYFFLTVFLCIFMAVLLFIPKYVLNSVKEIAGFCSKFPVVALICFVLVGLSAVPSVLWYLESKGSEYVLTMSRSLDANKDVLTVSPAMINSGSLFAQTSGEEMFAGFDTGLNFRTYVPVFVFIMFLLSFFNRISAQKLAIVGCGLVLFFITSGDVGPIQRFLYDHVGMFRSFRNYYFFIPFLTAVIILFLANELKEFLAWTEKVGRNSLLSGIYVLVVHALFFVFLLKMDDVPRSSFVTILLSAAWFCLWCVGIFRRHKHVFMLGLTAILLIQPCQVLPQFMCSFPPQKIQHPLTKPSFSYMRPLRGGGFNEEDGYSYTKIYKDDSGFFKKNYVGNRVSYDLQVNLRPKFLEDYVRYKFVVYDKVSFMDPHNPDWRKVADHLSGFVNEALVQDINGHGGRDVPGNAAILTGPSDQLSVEHFDLNDIKIRTNFAQRKFLVYNDSFHTDWKASIKGKQIAVYRANLAFKGIWVDAGEQHIIFSFRPGLQTFNCVLFLLFVSCLIWLIYLWRPGRRHAIQ